MNKKIIFYFIALVLSNYLVMAQLNQAMTPNTNNGNTNTNTNPNTNANTNPNTNSNTNSNTNANTNVNTNVSSSPTKNTGTKTLGSTSKTPLTEENVKHTCASDKSTLGMFSFHRPRSESVLVVNSNFTIVWYYNNIINEVYNYPKNNITLKLFYEEDADSNNWSNSWKKPVWSRTLNMNEIEEGPMLKNNVRSYQYNWMIIPLTTHGFLQSLKSNQKFKLRIYGDGKDIQSNAENYACYANNDIQPGITRAFLLVENNHIDNKYYSPIPIEDGASFLDRSTFKMLFLLLTVILFIME